MNVKQYRRRWEAQVKKAADAPNKTAAAHTRSLLAAKSASPKARAAAIGRTQTDPQSLGSLVEQYLRTLRDKDEVAEVRIAALDALKAAEFQGPRFDAHRADYAQALREAATDRSAQLREEALEVLAIQKDPYAQETLLRGLQDPKKSPVPLAKAIQLLGYDDHAAAAPAVRKVFDKANNTAKEEALRLLASDPGSEKLFSKLLKDKSQRSALRQLSAVGLQNLNPAAFEKAARRIVTDEDDYNEIRATCLSALTAAQGPQTAASNKRFASQVSKLQQATKSTNLRATMKRYLQTAQG